MAYLRAMREKPDMRSAFMSVFSALALTAMIVRALVPAGYMLSASETPGQLLAITICHGDGAAASQVVLDLDTGEFVDGAPKKDAPKEQRGKDVSCVFAMSAHLATPSLPAAIAPPVFEANIARLFSQFMAPGRGLVAPPPPARGPPSFV
jgi:hypothetical protein